MDSGITGDELDDEKMKALKKAIPFKDLDDARKEFIEKMNTVVNSKKEE